METGMARVDPHKAKDGTGIMKTGTIHVETGPVGRTLFLFAVPVIISQVLQEFYNIVDCAIVGHFAGGTALAAAGVSGLILSVLVNFFIGFSSGVSVITSRLFGEYAYAKLKTMISGVVKLVLAVGIIFTVGMLFLSGSALDWIHCPDNVRIEAGIYLKICLCGLTAQLLYNVGSAILRSLGDTRTPMLYFLGSVICNLILDLLLVVVFPLGIRGAAIATLASQWLLAAALLIRLIRLDPSYSLALHGNHLDRADIARILKLGLPAGLQALFMSVSSLLIQVFINAFGSAAIAGMTVFAKVEGALYFPAFAYGIALTGFVGQNYGARQYDRIRKATRISILVMFVVILPLSLLLLFCSPYILKVFTTDPAILQNAREAIKFTFPVYVFYAVNQVYLGTVKGLGSTFYPMICTLICYSIFRVFWCWILIPLHPTMRVVYLSYAVSFLLMLIMILPVYYRMIHKLVRSVSERQ